LTKGIRHLAFSKDEKTLKLVASGMDPHHCIAVFQIKDEYEKINHKLIEFCRSSTSPIWSLGFNTEGTEIVATGTNQVNVFNIKDGMKK
jgi:hypothetical protein